jgi:peptidoglycan hydrolase-like protein with peptidoglycan-binding domain
MKKLLLTGVTLVSLAALLPASAQQVGSPSKPASGSSVAQQGSSPAQLSRDDIMRAQQALDQKGFHAGRADGILGPRTKQALSMFQQQQKLQQTGQLDNRTLSALGVSQGPVSTTGAGTTQTGKSGVSTTGHSGAGKGPANMTQPSSGMNK